MDERQDTQNYEENGGEVIQAKKTALGDAFSFLKQVFFGLCWAMAGYVLGGIALPFGARPFGVAMLGGSDRKIFYIYAGLCLAAWNDPYRVLLLGIYSAILFVRLVVRFVLDPPWDEADGERIGEKNLGEVYPWLFSEHLSLRTATACLGAFAFGIYRLIEGGFLYYDLYGTILSAIVAPVSVLLFGGIFSGESEVGKTWRTVGIVSLAAAFLYGLGDWKIYGVSMAMLGCMLLTLFLTRKQGTVVGMIAGVICGVSVSVSLAPSFAFAALAAGLLFPFSCALAIIGSFSVAVAWGVYVSRLGILNGVLSAWISAAVLFFVWEKLFGDEREKTEKAHAAETVGVAERCLPLSENSIGELRLSEIQRRIGRLCESFSSLSEIFFEIGKQNRNPTASDLREICDRAFEDSCASCSEKNRCWGEQYRITAAEVGEISSALHGNGRVEMVHVGGELRARCGRIPDILEEINHNAALHQKQRMLGDRTEVFALDYGALSELLAASMTAEEELVCDTAAEAALCSALGEASLGITFVGVYGTRRRRVRLVASDESVLDRERERICEIVRNACPFAVEDGVISRENAGVIEFWERERLSLSYAKRTLLADGEEKYCGDTVGTFCREDGRFFALISDGMGAGREAALTSGVSGAYLRKMIDAGSSCEMAVRMLNEFLRNRGSGSLHECSATVDLMELDLMQGKAAFYKNGAAPTYVFRSGGIFKLRSRTVPVGILRESDTRRIGFDVSAGDMIVMVSDGVTQGKEECPWLFDLLRSQGEDVSVDRIADLVVKYAKGEGASDDLSVLVMKIGENKE